MIRIVGAVLVFGASCALGLFVDKFIKERYKSLCYIHDALSYLAINISSFDMQLKKALINADKSLVREDIFCEIAKSMETLGIKKAWKKTFLDNKSRLCLKDNDINAILPLANTLGTLDRDSEIRCINGIIQSLDVLAIEAKRDCEIKGGLYKKCSVLLGLLIVIMLM
ncbi:MAG: stage III sporulation protein AB [Clostridia bacterium]|nr:stage III sporulation protein AB [Clostridia bacterium]